MLGLTHKRVPEAVHTRGPNGPVAAKLASASQLMSFTLSWTAMRSGLGTNVAAACNGDNPQATSAAALIVVRIIPRSWTPDAIAIRKRNPRLRNKWRRIPVVRRPCLGPAARASPIPVNHVVRVRLVQPACEFERCGSIPV